MLALPPLVMAVPGGCIMAEGSLLAVRGLPALSTVLPPAPAIPLDLAADGGLSIALPGAMKQCVYRGSTQQRSTLLPFYRMLRSALVIPWQ